MDDFAPVVRVSFRDPGDIAVESVFIGPGKVTTILELKANDLNEPEIEVTFSGIPRDSEAASGAKQLLEYVVSALEQAIEEGFDGSENEEEN